MSRRALFDQTDDEDGFRRSYHPSDADLDITPMIDVTFLLLIFFMVTSTMQPPQTEDVPPARHGIGINATESVVIRIQAPAARGERPVIVLEGGHEGTLPEVRQMTDDARKAGRTQIIIRADREVPNGFVQDVIEQITAVEGLRFFIEVREEE